MTNANVVVALSAVTYFLWLVLNLHVVQELFYLFHVAVFLSLLHMLSQEAQEKSSAINTLFKETVAENENIQSDPEQNTTIKTEQMDALNDQMHTHSLYKLIWNWEYHDLQEDPTTSKYKTLTTEVVLLSTYAIFSIEPNAFDVADFVSQPSITQSTQKKIERTAFDIPDLNLQSSIQLYCIGTEATDTSHINTCEMSELTSFNNAYLKPQYDENMITKENKDSTKDQLFIQTTQKDFDLKSTRSDTKTSITEISTFTMSSTKPEPFPLIDTTSTTEKSSIFKGAIYSNNPELTLLSALNLHFQPDLRLTGSEIINSQLSEIDEDNMNLHYIEQNTKKPRHRFMSSIRRCTSAMGHICLAVVCCNRKN